MGIAPHCERLKTVHHDFMKVVTNAAPWYERAIDIWVWDIYRGPRTYEKKQLVRPEAKNIVCLSSPWGPIRQAKQAQAVQRKCMFL